MRSNQLLRDALFHGRFSLPQQQSCKGSTGRFFEGFTRHEGPIWCRVRAFDNQSGRSTLSVCFGSRACRFCIRRLARALPCMRLLQEARVVTFKFPRVARLASRNGDCHETQSTAQAAPAVSSTRSFFGNASKQVASYRVVAER